jgi:alkylation response protein AidB-like acyl-CoA dehydrogenase
MRLIRFFDDVRVLNENRLGEEGEGCMVAKYLLECERSVACAGQLRADLRAMMDMAKQASTDGFSLYKKAALRERLMEAEAELRAYEGIEFQILGEVSRGGDIGGNVFASQSDVLLAAATNRRIGAGCWRLLCDCAPIQFAAGRFD